MSMTTGAVNFSYTQSVEVKLTAVNTLNGCYSLEIFGLEISPTVKYIIRIILGTAWITIVDIAFYEVYLKISLKTYDNR